MTLMERKPMATGVHVLVTKNVLRNLPRQSDHARRESPSSVTLSRQQRRTHCECTAPLEIDPATGKSRYRIASANVCPRCFALQRRYEFHDYSHRRRLLPAGPTVLGGLHHATLGKA